MINSVIEVKCECGKFIKINVKSITKLQDRIDELEKELMEYKKDTYSHTERKSEEDLGFLKDMFGFK